MTTSINDQDLVNGAGGAILQSSPIVGFNRPPHQRIESENRGKWQLDFPTEAGRAYRVEFTTNFAEWTKLGEWMGRGSSDGITDPAAPEPERRFYRIVTP